MDSCLFGWRGLKGASHLRGAGFDLFSAVIKRNQPLSAGTVRSQPNHDLLLALMVVAVPKRKILLP